MPTPRDGETQEDFVQRCIPIVLEDGTAETDKQAMAVCYAMWDEVETGERGGGKPRRLGENEAETFAPPAKAKSNSRRGLNLCKTARLNIAEIDIARALLGDQGVSARTIGAMLNGLEMSELGKNRPGWGDSRSPSEDYLAWLLLGGDDGLKWARKMARKLEERMQEAEQTRTGEMDYIDQDYGYAYGATSFADLLQGERALELGDLGETRIAQFQMMAGRILANQEITDKVSAIRSLADELLELLTEIFGAVDETPMPEAEPAELGEAADFDSELPVQIIGVEEGEGDGGSVLYVDVVPISPGWGNKRDNHYYSRDLVERIAPIWQGVKMYATDHRDDEKSVLTEVSQIVRSPAGHTDDGVPYARAVILNPTFEEVVRRRDKANILGDLHCSILASGTARPGFERDGRKGKYVESITEAHSVDWVTKAGAGGHALAISESEAIMDKETLEQEQEQVRETEAEAEPVVVQESEEEETQEPAGEQEPVVEAELEEPTALSEADVSALIPDHLPEQTKARLLAREYESEAAVKEAVILEVEYLKAVTGAGRPIGVTGGTSKPIDMGEAAKEAQGRFDAVNSKWFGR